MYLLCCMFYHNVVCSSIKLFIVSFWFFRDAWKHCSVCWVAFQPVDVHFLFLQKNSIKWGVTDCPETRLLCCFLKVFCGFPRKSSNNPEKFEHSYTLVQFRVPQQYSGCASSAHCLIFEHWSNMVALALLVLFLLKRLTPQNFTSASDDFECSKNVD